MPGQQIHQWGSNAMERMVCQLKAIALLVAAIYAPGASAGDADMPDFSFSGFGTLGVVHSSEDQADFTSSTFKPDGAGFSHDWSADVDSLIGAQVTAKFTPQLSAVVQVISEQAFDNSYRPHVEWANIKYEFTPDFSVRVGRTALPVFLETDSRNVGYANPWVRPPIELYNLVPVTSNDGIDATYRMPVGTATNTFQISAGRSDSRFPNNGGGASVQVRKLVMFVDTFERGFMTVRLSYGRSHFTIPAFEPLLDAFRQFGPEGIALDEKYNVDNRAVTFLGIGASYDPGTWFVMGEWGRINLHSVLGESTGWYTSGGYRFGKFTPYATLGEVKADSNTTDPGLTVSALPPELQGTAAALNAALNSQLGAIAAQRTISIGGRWDFAKNMDLKLQLDHTRLGAGSAGNFINIQPGFQRGGKANMVSIAVDFVF
jgi:hypothetical protein